MHWKAIYFFDFVELVVFFMDIDFLLVENYDALKVYFDHRVSKVQTLSYRSKLTVIFQVLELCTEINCL